MTEPEIFILADHALNGVIAEIADDRWEMTMPKNFVMRRTGHTPTLRELINYHAYDDAWVPDMLAGRTMDEAGREQFDGDLLGEDPKGAYGKFMELACAAAEQVSDLDQTVHCSFGDFPMRHYFWQINSFRALRAYDIAKAIGVDGTLPEALVQGVWDEVSPHAEEWRALGVYPAAVPVSEDAPLLDRLLGLTGREPR